MTNPYLSALHRALPRLLSFYNMDSTSKKYGVGDRYYWAWKLIDFPNGSYQAAVHGLSLMLVNNLLPSFISEKEILNKINIMLVGLKNIISKNGSLDEALPNESSFCVTSLVASDFLGALELLNGHLSNEQIKIWIDVIKPLINFLKKQDEYHGFISNHLASAALAMFRWDKLVNDSKAKKCGELWLNRILENQSSEGWYKEYEGADPGYQTWCTTQLAQLYFLNETPVFGDSLKRSLKFLTYSAHPDGSFGGAYGSRNTRFLLPGGITMLSKMDENASALSFFSLTHLEKHHFVSLDCIDEGNFVPFFNDYALAAVALLNKEHFLLPNNLPFLSDNFRKYFSECGWLIDKKDNHYTIINFKKGGAVVHYRNNKRIIDSPGTLVRDKKGKMLTTQKSQPVFPAHFNFQHPVLTLDYNLQFFERPYPRPLDFFILRFFSMTIFKSIYLGNQIKKFLAFYLIKRKNKGRDVLRKTFCFSPVFEVRDEILSKKELKIIQPVPFFSAIHMASQGYWQKGDDLTLDGEL
jgi:hypothetical protein